MFIWTGVFVFRLNGIIYYVVYVLNIMPFIVGVEFLYLKIVYSNLKVITLLKNCWTNKKNNDYHNFSGTVSNTKVLEVQRNRVVGSNIQTISFDSFLINCFNKVILLTTQTNLFSTHSECLFNQLWKLNIQIQHKSCKKSTLLLIIL